MDRLGLDIDGVLYMWTEVVYREFVDHHGLTIDYDTFWKEQVKGITPYNQTVWDNIVRIPTFVSALKALPSDIATLKELAKRYEIYYITSRPPEVALATENWLKREGFPSVGNLIMGQKKEDVVTKLGIKYFVEDLIINVERLKNLTTVIIMNQPWNEGYTECIRIFNISELLTLL